jgi:type IV secretory pathway TraG/TraD family ATPase VirD4
MIHSKILQGCPIILCDSQYPSQIEIATYALSQGYSVHIFAPGFLESEVCNFLLLLRDSSDAETARQISTVINKNFRLLNNSNENGFFGTSGDQLTQAILMLTLEFGSFADVMTATAILKSEQMVKRLMAADLNPGIKMAFSQLFSCGSSSETAANIVSNTYAMFNHFMTSQSISCFIGKITLPQEIKRKQLIIFGFNRELNQAVTPLIWSVLLLLLSKHISESNEYFTLALDPSSRNYLTKFVNSSRQAFINNLVQVIILPLSRNKPEEFDWSAYKDIETFSFIKEFEARARLVEQKFPRPK